MTEYGKIIGSDLPLKEKNNMSESGLYTDDNILAERAKYELSKYKEMMDNIKSDSEKWILPKKYTFTYGKNGLINERPDIGKIIKIKTSSIINGEMVDIEKVYNVTKIGELDNKVTIEETGVEITRYK